MPPRPSTLPSQYPHPGANADTGRDPSRETGTGSRTIAHDLAPLDLITAGHYMLTAAGDAAQAEPARQIPQAGPPRSRYGPHRQ